MFGGFGPLNLEDSITQLMTHDRVLLAVDFDGTLAPLVEHPDDARIDDRATRILTVLARAPGVTVAVISGRALADLRMRLGDLPGVIAVGEHGNDFGSEAAPSAIIDAARHFFEVLRAGRDVVVESKPRSVTFHTRRLSDDETEEAVARVRVWANEHPEVTLLEGKEVLEVSTATRTKGDAIRDLAADVMATIYIGDDATDETVFAVLGPGDIGVKVGSGPSGAQFRVDDVAGVVELLEVAALAST